MQTVATLNRAALRPAALCKATTTRRAGLRAARLVVRAQEGNVEQPEQAVVEQPAASTPAPAAAAAAPFSILGPQQEAINGRAAMIGMLIAAGSELATHQSVWSQIAGKYVDRELVEAPIGLATMSFGFVVIALTFATFAPLVFANQGPTARSFGPFTPKAELTNGRIAQLGFASLLLVEFLRGNVALF